MSCDTGTGVQIPPSPHEHFRSLHFFFFFASVGDDPEPSEPFPKYYKRVDDGEKLKKQIDHDGDGFFISAVRSDTQSEDTLSVYIQGVVKGRVKPDRRKASKADLVIWCFPSTYRHPNHVFPNAKGRIYILEQQGRLVVATAEFLQKYRSQSNLNTAGL